MYLYESKIVLEGVRRGISSAVVVKRFVTAFLNSKSSSLGPRLALETSMEETERCSGREPDSCEFPAQYVHVFVGER